MTQLGEGVAVAIVPNGEEECVFCQKTHQDAKSAPAGSEFPRLMSQLKPQGRAHTIGSNRKDLYPSSALPPLIDWSGAPIEELGGYKAAAHHCIALKSLNKHKLRGEIREAGYDPNRGSNCIWLPYSRAQFLRARAYAQKTGRKSIALQKHRGGHTDEYFDQVSRGLDAARNYVAKTFCTENKKASKEELLQFLTNVESVIWSGVSTAVISVYQLYNESFLAPKLIWGGYDEERTPAGKAALPDDILKTTPADQADEAQNKKDDDDNET